MDAPATFIRPSKPHEEWFPNVEARAAARAEALEGYSAEMLEAAASRGLRGERAPELLLHLQRADSIVPSVTPWLIEDYLVESTLAGLVAPSGACKTFLSIDWACCIATGTPWNGHAVKQGPVIYLAGEGRHGLSKRFAAWAIFHGVSIAGAPLYVSEGLPFLCSDLITACAVDEMRNVALAGASLVVIDTVARAMGGANENSAEDMSALIRSMDFIRRECGATVLSVHHTGNSPSEQGRARGSSAYRAALDSEFLLRASGVEEVELSTSKSKDWVPSDPLRLRKRVVPIDIGERSESSLILQPTASAKAEIDKQPLVSDLHGQGKTVREISEQLGVPRSTVGRWVKASHMPTSQGIPAGAG